MNIKTTQITAVLLFGMLMEYRKVMIEADFVKMPVTGN
jgi:hypothetical protein